MKMKFYLGYLGLYADYVTPTTYRFLGGTRGLLSTKL